MRPTRFWPGTSFAVRPRRLLEIALPRACRSRGSSRGRARERTATSSISGSLSCRNTAGRPSRARRPGSARGSCPRGRPPRVAAGCARHASPGRELDGVESSCTRCSGTGGRRGVWRSPSRGARVLSTIDFARITIPGMQNPHWRPAAATKTRPEARSSAGSPSSVRMVFPATSRPHRARHPRIPSTRTSSSRTGPAVRPSFGEMRPHRSRRDRARCLRARRSPRSTGR